MIKIFIKIWQEQQLLHVKDLSTFIVISRSVLLRIRNISGKIKVLEKNQNTHFGFSKFFSPENRAFHEITWKETVQPERYVTFFMLYSLGYKHTLRICNFFFLFFHSNHVYANASQYHIISTLTVLFLWYII